MSNFIRPQPGPQTDFLRSSADLVVFGGSGGGGKTAGLLLRGLRYIHLPTFRYTIFRKSFKQIHEAGGIFDSAREFYIPLGATPVVTKSEFRFPSGARVRFSYLDKPDDKYEYQGAEIPMMGFDEGTHFTMDTVFYLLSRNRSTLDIPSTCAITCNPDPFHWLAEFLSPWINKETGFPEPEMSGKKKWFLRKADEIIWFDRKEDAKKYASVELGDEDVNARSVTFIPSSIYDNKILMEKDPEYISNLKSMSYVDRMALLEGNWKTIKGAGMYFRPEWWPIVDAARASFHKVRFWDTAGTEGGGDYTVGVLMSRTSEGYYTIEDVVRGQWSPRGVEDVIKNTASRDGKSVVIGVEQESGASGKSAAQYMARQLAGYQVKLIPSSSSKVERAKPLSSQVEAGNVSLVRGDWNKPFIDEMNNYTGDKSTKSTKDDQVDAASGAFHLLNRTRPAIYVPIHSIRK